MTKFLLLLSNTVALASLVSVWFLHAELKKYLAKENEMNQQRIDDLTAQVKAGNEDTSVIDVIKSESEQVKAAIADSNIDTTALEAALAERAEKDATVKTLIADILVPAPVEETPPTVLPEGNGTETGEVTEPGKETANGATSEESFAVTDEVRGRSSRK